MALRPAPKQDALATATKPKDAPATEAQMRKTQAYVESQTRKELTEKAAARAKLRKQQQAQMAKLQAAAEAEAARARAKAAKGKTAKPAAARASTTRGSSSKMTESELRTEHIMADYYWARLGKMYAEKKITNPKTVELIERNNGIRPPKMHSDEIKWHADFNKASTRAHTGAQALFDIGKGTTRNLGQLATHHLNVCIEPTPDRPQYESFADAVFDREGDNGDDLYAALLRWSATQDQERGWLWTALGIAATGAQLHAINRWGIDPAQATTEPVPEDAPPATASTTPDHVSEPAATATQPESVPDAAVSVEPAPVLLIRDYVPTPVAATVAQDKKKSEAEKQKKRPRFRSKLGAKRT